MVDGMLRESSLYHANGNGVVGVLGDSDDMAISRDLKSGNAVRESEFRLTQ